MIQINFLPRAELSIASKHRVSPQVDSPTSCFGCVSYRDCIRLLRNSWKFRIVSGFRYDRYTIHVDKSVYQLSIRPTRRAGRRTSLPHSMPCPYQLELEIDPVSSIVYQARRLERSRSDRCLAISDKALSQRGILHCRIYHFDLL